MSRAYYLVGTDNPSRASVKDVGFTALGIAVAYGQFVAMTSYLRVKWPSSFRSVSDSSQILLLDLDMVSFACIGGSSAAVRYIVKALFFPASVLLIIAWFVISFRVRAGWDKYRTMNLVGHFLQAETVKVLASRPAHLEKWVGNVETSPKPQRILRLSSR